MFVCLFVHLNFSSSPLSIYLPSFLLSIYLPSFLPYINIFTFLPSFLPSFLLSIDLYSYLLLFTFSLPLYLISFFSCFIFSIHHSNSIQQMVGVPSSPQMSRNYPQGGQIQSPNQGSKKKNFLTYYNDVFL